MAVTVTKPRFSHSQIFSHRSQILLSQAVFDYDYEQNGGAMWYESYGFSQNPFRITPSPDIIGYEEEREQLSTAINSRNMIVVTGPIGSGKTSLLRHAMTKHSGIYHDCSAAPASDFSMERLLTRCSFFGLVRRKIRDVVFFCDEIQKLDPDKAEEIKSAYDAGILSAVVLSTIDELNIVDSMKSRISERIELNYPCAEILGKIIAQRTAGGINPFSQDAVVELVKRSQNNPRLTLINAERVCKAVYATHNSPNSITAEIIALHLRGQPRAEKKPVLQEPGVFGPAEKLKARLSPLQYAIVAAISESNTALTYEDLVKAVGKEKGSIAKQLSRLALISDVELMGRKGVSEPIVVKKTRQGKPVFDLTDEARFALGKR